MLLTKTKIEQILGIIRRRNNLFVIRNIGPEVLSDRDILELTEEYGAEALFQVQDFVKDGYLAGYTRSPDLGTATNVSLEDFQEDTKPFLNSFEEYSVEHSKEIVESYVQKLSQETQTSFENLIREYNKVYKDYLLTNTGVPLAIQAQQGQRLVSELVTAMRDLTGDVARNWERVARTEMTNVINVGMADKIIKMNPETDSSEIVVFKRVVNDERLCPHCRRLHLESDGSTPKIYTMSQALANGSNVGRKANEWVFTIGAVHPYCRCQLVQLPPGYYFGKDSKMSFVGEAEANRLIQLNLQ